MVDEIENQAFVINHLVCLKKRKEKKNTDTKEQLCIISL